MTAAGVHPSTQAAALAAHPALAALQVNKICLHALLQSVPADLHNAAVHAALTYPSEFPPTLIIVADKTEHSALCARVRHALSSISAPLLLELHIGSEFLMAAQCMHEAYILLQDAALSPDVDISVWLGGQAVVWERELPWPDEPEPGSSVGLLCISRGLSLSLLLSAAVPLLPKCAVTEKMVVAGVASMPVPGSSFVSLRPKATSSRA